ncbi:MAG: hypothetical protein COX57_02665 [Alphaproteobacteria bacterium CG_4_10_14_0_2_um_filter_63_37]|nr:MAG: hypothetical protein AUJ55_10360 [Proteobacteria bacterium CG1_02_64_396]PJA25580.1 MAG: hypothetical protein COX57_02665 [Alphaproteobacteria bacterium CG_4_10_14_0_2_um_filter_63_37]
MPPLVLASDFGIVSPYPGQMELAARACGWAGDIVQLWHEWPSFRVDLGPVLLPRLVRPLPLGSVVVAVVDPGVGSDRRVVAVPWQGATWIAPDNGLLSAILGEGAPSYDLEDYRPVASSAHTFHGRDWMVAAAADFLTGRASLADLPFAPNPTMCSLPPPGLAFWDAFGNAVTTCPWEGGAAGAWWSAEGCLTQVEHFSQQPPGRLVAVRGSLGLWEVAVVEGSARQHLDGTLDLLCWKDQ